MEDFLDDLGTDELLFEEDEVKPADEKTEEDETPADEKEEEDMPDDEKKLTEKKKAKK